ncbi:hypothetical protein PAHA111176_05170 [Parendozoicomonas haliclonae]|uniref:Uncharacterized protein n=1 Tax=Parendozoicomonas haliclonae TaxID=1960125 RepID=A0A1X7AJZ1_9GAMM|nr:hypothetical protein EHSB41UT_02396 [Parendozoicomonas haliclonae]
MFCNVSKLNTEQLEYFINRQKAAGCKVELHGWWLKVSHSPN